MRMWGSINPKFLCNRHLLGEHVEMHMFVGTINKGISIEGYIRNNLVNPSYIEARHKELSDEMIRRGMNHNSILPKLNLNNVPSGWRQYPIDTNVIEGILISRCQDCGKNILMNRGRRNWNTISSKM